MARLRREPRTKSETVRFVAWRDKLNNMNLEELVELFNTATSSHTVFEFKELTELMLERMKELKKGARQ